MKSIIYAGLTFGFVLFFSVNAIRAADHEWSYKGIMFDEEMREFSVIQIKFKQRQNSTTAVMSDHTVMHLCYRGFSPYKSKRYYHSIENNKYVQDDDEDREMKIIENRGNSTDGTAAEGFLRIGGHIRYKFFLFSESKYKIIDQWMNGKLWVGEKCDGLPNGYGAFMDYQTEFTTQDDKVLHGYPSERECYSDYKNGTPFFRIGEFQNGVFLHGYTHITFDFPNHSYEVQGYNKILAPVIDGKLQGAGILYRWSYDPYEPAFSNVFVGKFDGMFFADGIVKGYNFKNELANECICQNQKLRCKQLQQTIEEKKFTEFLGIATIAVAEASILLKLAGELSGPGNSSGSINNSKPKSQSHICWDASSIKQAKNCGSGFKQPCFEDGSPVYLVKCSNGSNKYYYKSKTGYFYEYISLAADRQLPSDYNRMLKDLCGCKE